MARRSSDVAIAERARVRGEGIRSQLTTAVGRVRSLGPPGPSGSSTHYWRNLLGSPYVALIVVTTIWGSLHPLGKFTMRDVTPVQLVFARVFFAGLTLAFLLALQGKVSDVAHELRHRTGTVLLLATFSFFGSSGASMIALSLLPASASSLLSNTSPLFVAMGAIALTGRRTKPIAIGGVLLGFVGLGLVIFGENPNGFGTLGLNPLGVALSLIGSLTWAIYIGLGRRAMAKGNPLAVVAASSLFGGVAWLVISAITGDLARFLTLSLVDWGLIAYLGVVGTGITYGLWTAALARLSAARVAVFQYAIPFWAVVLSVLLLGEQVTVPLVLGGIGIVAGIAIAQSTR
jgi:drug/metabolite transporter (DMT)-like permease